MTKKSKQIIDSTKYNMKSALVNYFLVLMFTLFPLFYTQQYSNIRHDKYYFFIISALILIVTAGAYILSEPTLKSGIQKDKRWYQKLSFTDWSMLALLVSNTLTTLMSPYIMDSITGNQGRNNGLILIALYVGIYFIISRAYVFKEYVFGAFAVGSMLVFLLSIINYFYIDPLHMFDNYEERYVIDFSSTIGNKNLMSSFVCICLPVLMLLFISTKHKKLKWLYFSSAIIGFSSLLVSDSDSGFLGFILFFAIVIVYYIRKIKQLCSLFFVFSAMLAGAKLLRLFSFIMSDNSKGFTTIQSFFIYNNLSYILLAVCVVITIALYLISKNNNELLLPKYVFFIALAILVLGTVSVIFAFIYYSIIDTTTELSGIKSYFRFNDHWGTHRGYMWRICFEIFSSFNIKDIFFGCGLDTLYSAFQPHFTELSKLYGDSSTNCAHNEYINYLVTTGIFGLTAYISVLISFIIRAVKASSQQPFAMVCCAGVLCYAIQATVNIAQPITTPLFILLICIGEAFIRKSKNDLTI